MLLLCTFFGAFSFAGAQNAGGPGNFTNQIECASSFHLYSNVRLYQLNPDGSATESYASIPDELTDEQLQATRDAIANGEYGCPQTTTTTGETVFVLPSDGLRSDSSLGSISELTKECASTYSQCNSQRAGWYPNATGCAEDPLITGSSDICFYYREDGGGENTDDMCGLYDEQAETYQECFPSADLCEASMQLASEQNSGSVLSGCPVNESQVGVCQNAPSYCFVRRQLQGVDGNAGDGIVCSTAGFRQNVSDASDYDEEDRARALSQCNAIRQSYLVNNQNPPACQPDYSFVSGITLNGNYKMCFDATGLTRLTQTEINQIIADEAQAERDRILAIQQAAFDATRFGGSEGGIVPECGENGTGSTCGWIELVALANNIINFIVWAAGIVVVIAIFMAGFRLVTARGNPSELTKAKSALAKAIGGFCVVLLAWLLVSTVMSSFLRPDLVNDPVSNLLENQ